MNFDMTNPCCNCPFRKDIPPYLTANRVREIDGSLIRGDFPCHKTTVPDDDDDDDFGKMKPTSESQHCAGALIMMERMERPSQMMRIAERLGMYDRRKLNMESPVYDDFDEMEEAQPR